MSDLINPKSYIEAIKQGSAAPEKPTTVVTTGEDTEPSAVGGLAALGATVLGATALGRRFKSIRNYFKPSESVKNVTFDIPKPVMATDNIPTATGQSSELVSTGKALVPMKSRIGEVEEIPFSYGAGYKGTNPLVGSAAFDRVMEAPFEKASAKEWTKWLTDANRGNLRVSTGPLAGVSRQVQSEELADLNLITRDKDGQFGGFLKHADDSNIEVERDQLLDMIKNHPINKIKKVVFDVEGDPISDLKELQTDFVSIINKIPEEPKKRAAQVSFQDEVMENFNEMGDRNLYGNRPFNQESINSIQNKVVKAAQDIPEIRTDLQNYLVRFNRFFGNHQKRAQTLNTDEIFESDNIKLDLRDYDSGKNYYPKYRGYNGGQYNLLGGENFTENVYVFDGKIPKVSGDRFNFAEGSPHYFSNKELMFARFDDLPNPKIGGRHLRLSEVQSDIHSPSRASNSSVREEFFSQNINTFNSDAVVNDLKRKRQNILDELQPYTEIGRGALTRAQEQKKSRLLYQLNQIDRSAVRELATKGQIDATTYAPMRNNYNDYVIKDLLRTMAEKNINAISVVPAPMNQNIKGLYDASKIGNEINYGLMNGKKLSRLDEKAAQKGKGAIGQIVPSSKFSDLNESLRKIASQYGAEFKKMPMPKSNPNKQFKVIEKILNDKNKEAIKEGRKHYNKTQGQTAIYENHLSAFDTEEAAERAAAVYRNRGSGRGDIEVVQMNPENPRNYEEVMTLVAPNDVLKKFLLPFKAYMNEGGFVDKVNIFKPLI